jgi:hypothetical protein
LGDAENNPAFCDSFLDRHNAHEARVDLLIALSKRSVMLGHAAV